MPRPPITTFSSVAVKEVSTNKNNGLYVPQLTTNQRDAIPIANLEKRGGIIYNTTDNVFQFFQNGNWINLNSSGGNVVGPNTSTANNIAVFDGTTGKIIKDSGVAITQVPESIIEALFALTEENNSIPSLFSNDVINEIGNLGHIKFVNDLGIIFVDGLMPVEFITNNIGDEEQVCSLFTGGLPSSSSSPSALLELQTSTGALLFSRLTQTEINALILPVVGMVVYNTTTNKLNVYTSTGWLPLLTNADIPSTTVTLTGGVTGNGTTGSSITTTVVSVAPSAINGYPNTTSTFLRGDGTWTNVLSERLGIGTSAPNAPLQFSNTFENRKIVLLETGNNNNQVRSIGTAINSLVFQVEEFTTNYVFNAFSSNANINFELMRITGSGNVGIGTSTPNAPLQFSNDFVNNKIVLYENSPNTHQIRGLGTNNTAFRFQVDGTFVNYTFNAATSSTTSNELVRITGTGNVGIGTTNPTFPLDVIGVINSESLRSSFFLTSTDLENNYIQLLGVNVNGNPGNRYIRYRSGSAAYSLAGNIYSNFDSQHYFIVADGFGWRFNVLNSVTTTPSFTSSVTAICITSLSMVGIGTTTANAPLQFSNTLANRKIVLLESANNDHQVIGLGTASNTFRFQVNSTSSDYVFNAGNSSTGSNELLRIKGTGNVGIGTSTPNAPLQFSNTFENKKIVLYSLTTDDHQFLGLGTGFNTFRFQVESQIFDYVFYAGNINNTSTELVRIRGNGNVGIKSTTGPNAPLQFSNTFENRKIVLLESANNDHQVMGLGTASNTFRFQVNSTSSDYVFNAGAGSSASNEVARIKGNGDVIVQGNLYGNRPYGSIAFINSTPTTQSVTANVLVKINVVTSAGPLNLFSATSNRLTYTGTQTINAHVIAIHTSSPSVSTSVIQRIVIYKNGTSANIDVVGVQQSNTQTMNLTTQGILSLSTNDFIEVFINSGTTQTVSHYSLILTVNTI
jgi:hypothetical protein